MDYIKEESLLGNKKIVVGDKSHPLVLANSGSIYVLYGGSYKKLDEYIKTLIAEALQSLDLSLYLLTAGGTMTGELSLEGGLKTNSKDLVENLNANYLEGLDSTLFARANTTNEGIWTFDKVIDLSKETIITDDSGNIIDIQSSYEDSENDNIQQYAYGYNSDLLDTQEIQENQIRINDGKIQIATKVVDNDSTKIEWENMNLSESDGKYYLLLYENKNS